MTSPRTSKTMDGLILAGGLSRRMGRDKALLPVGDRHLLAHQIHMMAAQVDTLFVAGNHLNAALQLTLPLSVHDIGAASVSGAECPNFPLPANVVWLTDYLAGAEGPLSGLMAGLSASQADYLWVSSCDSYGVPASTGSDLLNALQSADAQLAYLNVDGRSQPLQAVLACGLLESLGHWLDEGHRAVMRWYRTCDFVELAVCANNESSYNINTPDDYAVLLTTLHQ